MAGVNDDVDSTYWNLPLLLTTLQSKQLENTKIHLRQERVFLKYYSTLFL